METSLVKAYQLLQEHYWSLDEADFSDYAAHEGDVASPDEFETLGAVTAAPVEAPSEYLGQDPVYATIRAMNAARTASSSKGKMVFWKTVVRKKPTCPFENPQPVLNSHTDLAFLFLVVASDEQGNDLDLREYRNDKTFDQFLSWRMVAYLKKKGNTGQWNGNTGSSAESAKRKREEDDTGEDEVPTPPKKPALARATASKTRSTVVEEGAVVTAKIAVPGRKTSTRARSAKVMPPQCTAKAQAKNASKKVSPSRAAPKVAKAQPTKAAAKKAASRKAQVIRKPSSPRRSAALKAEVTGRGRAPKTKAAERPAPPPTRRSARLASKA